MLEASINLLPIKGKKLFNFICISKACITLKNRARADLNSFYWLFLKKLFILHLVKYAKSTINLKYIKEMFILHFALYIDPEGPETSLLNTLNFFFTSLSITQLLHILPLFERFVHFDCVW